MQPLYSGPTSLGRLTALDWRLGALVLAGLICSQGCGTIADPPDRPLAMRGVSASESQTRNTTSERHAGAEDRNQTPPDPSPLPEQTKQAPEIEDNPSPAQAISIEMGIASWYGAKHHGRRTASGEVFNQEHFTAAHPTLPFGSRVKVINLDTGKSVVVRINDRGPYKKGRIIDVSRAAARALGMVQQGVATVRLEWTSDPQKATDLAAQGR